MNDTGNEDEAELKLLTLQGANDTGWSNEDVSFTVDLEELLPFRQYFNKLQALCVCTATH